MTLTFGNGNDLDWALFQIEIIKDSVPTTCDNPTVTGGDCGATQYGEDIYYWEKGETLIISDTGANFCDAACTLSVRVKYDGEVIGWASLKLDDPTAVAVTMDDIPDTWMTPVCSGLESRDGTEEEEKGLLDKLASNAIVGPLLEFMDSTTGQIVSVLLGVLAFAGRMVLARGQRAKNKRVRKFSNRIRNAETIGRLKIIEQDVEKANDKNRLPRGGFGDLMEQIETRMEKLGFDGQPEDGGTSGDWSSDDGQDEWQDDFQQAADMMWDAKDMMADAKEEAAMARQAIEDMQQQMGHQPRRQEPEPEPEEQFNSRYVTAGIDASEGGAAGPSLPGSRMMDLDGDGIVTQEEKEIWASMTAAEREQFFSPITNIAEEIRRRNLLNEKREKMNLKKSDKKDKKRKKKGKKDKRW
jgi:hypothetical protein